MALYVAFRSELLMSSGAVRDMVEHLERCLARSMADTSSLSDDVLRLPGFSGIMTRHLYNNVCSLRVPGRDTRYLEVGTWKGSSLVSALFGNDHVHATVVDNWSQFGGPKEDFLATVQRLLPSAHLDVVDRDCFKVDPAELLAASSVAGTPIDIYLFDGEHTYEAQRRAITHFAPALRRDAAIVMVDDWNWPDVRAGTMKGIQDAGLRIQFQYELRHTLDDTHTESETAGRQFWNGIGVFVLAEAAMP
jgi:hypothetical protein